MVVFNIAWRSYRFSNFYYWVWILPGYLHLNFLISCSCADPPKFYGISLHSIHVCRDDFTKKYKKQSLWRKYFGHNLILPGHSKCSKKLQATYTELKIQPNTPFSVPGAEWTWRNLVSFVTLSSCHNPRRYALRTWRNSDFVILFNYRDDLKIFIIPVPIELIKLLQPDENMSILESIHITIPPIAFHQIRKDRRLTLQKMIPIPWLWLTIWHLANLNIVMCMTRDERYLRVTRPGSWLGSRSLGLIFNVRRPRWPVRVHGLVLPTAWRKSYYTEFKSKIWEFQSFHHGPSCWLIL